MELIGEYHRDKVLCLPENQRKQMELPPWKNAEVVNEIFGSVLRQGKEIIECRSAHEARFIWALWSFEWTDFWVPTDDKYLAEILPRLLVLKELHDEVINARCSLYSNRKVSEELRRRIYLAATLRDEVFIGEEEIAEEEITNDDFENEEVTLTNHTETEV